MTQVELAALQNKSIMVLGGNGFIGRHIVRRLRKAGSKVIVGTRAEAGLNPYERKICFHQMLQDEQWASALAGIDMVVNAVGILRERKGQRFETVHHMAVKKLAETCDIKGIKLVHISAIGLHDGLKAPFSVYKKKGEQAIINTQADWHIIRASLVEGEGAYGADWFKKVARWPVHLIPEKHALISPVDVAVIVEKVLALLVRNTEKIPLYHRIHEVSNGIDYLLPDYLVALNGGRTRFAIIVPDALVRLATGVCDLFNLTPLTLGHYELLTYDSCPERSQR